MNEFLDKEIDYVVTVCDLARQTCPFFPGRKKTIHRGFEDPAALHGSDDEKIALFRHARDEMRAWIAVEPKVFQNPGF